MLHIWVGKYERYDAVHKPDTYFDINLDYKLTGTDFAKRLIHDCSQESEVIAPGYLSTLREGIIPLITYRQVLRLYSLQSIIRK